MNSYFQDKNFRSMLRYISVMLLLVILFVVTYNVAGNISENNNDSENEERVVYNTSDGLDDDFLITLKIGNEEEQITINEFKEESYIGSSITQEDLLEFYSDRGYEILALTSSEIVFEKEESGDFIPNKYYIGEKDNFLAIYKTDENGNPFIESETDIYTVKSIDMIPVSEVEIEELKNFKYYYDTKEGAVEKISAYTS